MFNLFKVRVSIRTCVPNLGAVRRERFLTIDNPLNPPREGWVNFFLRREYLSAHACQIWARSDVTGPQKAKRRIALSDLSTHADRNSYFPTWTARDVNNTYRAPGRMFFFNRSTLQCDDILTNQLAANTFVIGSQDANLSVRCKKIVGRHLAYTLVGNYVLAVCNVSYILFINPRALFCHYHVKCHSINIHNILVGNID